MHRDVELDPLAAAVLLILPDQVRARFRFRFRFQFRDFETSRLRDFEFKFEFEFKFKFKFKFNLEFPTDVLSFSRSDPESVARHSRGPPSRDLGAC